MTAMATEKLKSAVRSLDAMRFLLAADLVAIFFSPPVTNLIELLIIAVVLASPQVRARLADVLREPPVYLTLAFVAVLTLGVVYSMASLERALSMYTGWRKILLLPLAYAVFDTPAAKLMLARTFFAVMAFFAVLSYGLAWSGTLYYQQAELGVVVRNHSAQGMVFSVAAFAAACLWRQRDVRMPAWLLGVLGLLWTANIVFVSPGRAGYVTLIVLALALTLHAAQRQRAAPWKTWGAIGVVVATGIGLLWASPVAYERIRLGMHEVQEYEQATGVTSGGIRMHMWRNALPMIAERPLLGAGTGAFGVAYARQVAGKPGVEGETLAADPHNQYMNIAAENGLVGLGVFLALLVALFRQPVAMPFRLLGVGALAAWCATSLFYSHFGIFSEGRFIYLWAGAMLAPARR